MLKYKQADIMLIHLLINSKKLAQAVDEFTKWLNACAEAWVHTVSIYSE